MIQRTGERTTGGIYLLVLILMAGTLAARPALLAAAGCGRIGFVSPDCLAEMPCIHPPASIRSALLYSAAGSVGLSGASPVRYRSRELFEAVPENTVPAGRPGETGLCANPFERHRSDAVSVFTSNATNRRDDDRWLAFDKVQHLTFSFLWTLGTQYVAVNKIALSEHRALPLSITSSAAAGLGKEIYDRQVGPTRYFSPRDLVADAIGIVLAVGIILL